MKEFDTKKSAPKGEKIEKTKKIMCTSPGTTLPQNYISQSKTSTPKVKTLKPYAINSKL